jgi:hypothetical protein
LHQPQHLLVFTVNAEVFLHQSLVSGLVAKKEVERTEAVVVFTSRSSAGI